MCTVSFIARQRGYLLAMNRDEQLARAKGLPPEIISRAGRRIVRPSEPGGGTWIALNDAGVTFALINWYAVAARVKASPVSRGEVVNSVSAEFLAASASEILSQLPLQRMNPFRLIGFFPATQKVFEWRWDLKRFICQPHPWRTQQFISSGFDELAAQRIRSETFRQARRQTSAGSLDWLRRLHRSHAPEPGPGATCMHRADAATVSCTTVQVSRGATVMWHQLGRPCLVAKKSWSRIRLPPPFKGS